RGVELMVSLNGMVRWTVVPALLLMSSAAASHARDRIGAPTSDPIPRNLPYDGRFIFARLRYTVANGGYYYRGLPAWAHGYSHAEENLMRLTHEVTLLTAPLDGYNLYAIDDPQLFRYPVDHMTEAGYW